MMDPRNVVVLSGGLVADPEKPTEKIVKLRLAVDYAGRDKDSDDRSGYFDVTYYLNDDNPNAKFVKGQLEQGNLKKGSSISIVGRLEHDRFKTKDGTKASRVQIVADAISYFGRASKPADAATNGGGAQTPAAQPAAGEPDLLPAPADF
jgi:single-stranded DNA-binding protein